MSSKFIHKNLIREICKFGDQNQNKFLQQKTNPQNRLDVQLLRQKISSLKHTAALNGLVSLSAPQIKIKNRIFVIIKQQFLKYSQWTGYEDLFLTKKPQQCYDAIINPQLIGYSDFKIKGSQECPSIQGLKFKVWIPLINKMKFTKYLQLTQRKNGPAFKSYQQSLTGFYGRVFDHQYRHLQGLLVNTPQISNDEVYLTNDAMEDPQNFELLKSYRMETRFFNDESFDKYIEEEKNRLNKQQNQKISSVEAFKKNFMNIPDKIDDKIRQKLKRSYEMTKGKNLGNSALKLNQEIPLKIGSPTLQTNKVSKIQEKSKKFQKNKFNKK